MWVKSSKSDIVLVASFRCRSRSALSPDVKSVSIVWPTGGVIGNVSWQQHFSLTLWELAQRQRKVGVGRRGYMGMGMGQREKDRRREGGGWQNRKGMDGAGEQVCASACQGTVLPISLVTAGAWIKYRFVCLSVHACRSCRPHYFWKKAGVIWNPKGPDRCPAAHTGPLIPYRPFLNVTGHLAHWLGL